MGTTARGHGPAPAGFFTCRDPKCDSQRDPFSGRFQKIPNHYHPLAQYSEYHPLNVLRHHVTGAVQRGEAEPITERTS